ncbi:MAG: uroporphyrinogen-III synthase [Aeromicrobium sp.]
MINKQLGPVLAGTKVLITAQRRASDLALALERRGASVAIAPSIGVESHIDEDALLAQTKRVIDDGVDVVILTTGIGFRGWLETAEAAGLGAALVDALSGTRLIARGPKASGALQAAGLTPDWVAETETSAEIAELLLAEGVAGQSIAVQHHGAGDDHLEERLTAAGAATQGLVVYRWGAPPDAAALRASVRDAANGAYDAVTFTSAPGAAAWLTAARAEGVDDEIARATKDGSLVLAAVGPVTAEPLVAAGFEPIVPERFRLGALVRLIITHCGENAEGIRTPAGVLRVRATAASLDHQVLSLSPGGLAILRELAREPGRVKSREELLSVMPGESGDPHAAEVAVARLREIVGKDVVRTVVKRGYALAVLPS